MPATIPFLRAARHYADWPCAEVVLQSPPDAPSVPSVSLIALLLPFAGMAVSVVLMVTLAHSFYSLLTLPVMLMSVGAGIYSYVAARRKYNRQMDARAENYHQYLDQMRRHLESLQVAQRAAERQTHPPAEIWLERARQAEAAVWERSPGEADFLELRLGIGVRPPVFTIKPPPPARLGSPDEPLLEAAQALSQSFTLVAEALITAPLAGLNGLGIYGPRAATLSAVRAWLAQLAGAHAPTEVQLALVCPRAERSEWAWARWLPHLLSPAGRHRQMAETADEARLLLNNLQEQMRQAENQPQPPRVVLVIADLRLVDWGLLRTIWQPAGETNWLHCLFVVDQVGQIPKGCQGTVELEKPEAWRGLGARLRVLGPPTQEWNFAPDALDAQTAEYLARALAPLQLVGAEAAGSRDLPDQVPLFSLCDCDTAGVLNNWRQAQPYRSLAVPIGCQAGGAPLLLDVHENGHGPHGLIGGTTGSGKSELLQTLIVALAAHFSPHDLAFVLVDYKGGALARSVEGLPHVLGVISNLEGSLAGRALLTLRAELKRRQTLFAQAEVDHIDKYQRLRQQKTALPPLPRLMLIVDEFAELAKEQPDFLNALVSTGRVGRSLGVHLLLATQKPAGVVSNDIWSNSRYRLCLRVEQPGDSREVLRRPDAAYLSRRTPGRVYLQVGTDEIFNLFQSAYGAIRYDPAQAAAEREAVYRLEPPGGGRCRLGPAVPLAEDALTQQATLIQRIAAAARQGGLAPLPAIWQPPLPEMLYTDQLPYTLEGEWLAPVVGQVDDPEQQEQRPLALPLGRFGHALICGMPGSGKTTVLETLLLNLARSVAPEQAQIYVLDFGRRQLKGLERLPHVGGVVVPEEAERLQRLLDMLTRELEARQSWLAEKAAATFSAYIEQLAGALPEKPAVVLVVDNYANLAAAQPNAPEVLLRLAREGGNLGLHLVLTATAPNVVSYRVSENLGLALALELNDAADYTTVVGRPSVYPAKGRRGRGLVRGKPPLEAQIALTHRGELDAERLQARRAEIDQLAAQYPLPRRARPIPEQPQVVPLETVLPAAPVGRLPAGVNLNTLETCQVPFEPGGTTLLIGGSQGGGKTTLVQSLVLAVAQQCAPKQVQMCLVNFGRPSLLALARLPHVAAYVQTAEAFEARLTALQAELQTRRQTLDTALREAGGLLDEARFVAEHFVSWLWVIEDWDMALPGLTDQTRALLEPILRQGGGLGLHVWLSGASDQLSAASDRSLRTLRSRQCGFVLGVGDGNLMDGLGARLNSQQSGRWLPPGQGYFIWRGKAQFFLAATPQQGAVTLIQWVDQIVRRWPTNGEGRHE